MAMNGLLGGAISGKPEPVKRTKTAKRRNTGSARKLRAL
jgi:hypothetical protein